MTDSIWKRIKTEIEHWNRSTWSFEAVGDHWDATKDYDDINDETYSYFRRFIDGLRFSNIPHGASVLDFCARTGNGTAYFYQNKKIDKAVCADVSRRMGQICRERVQNVGLRKFMWVPVNDYVLPFARASFDAVLCFETVEHFSEPFRLIKEMSRVLRPGGNLILTTPNLLWEPVHAFAAIAKLHHSEGPHRFIPYRHLLGMVKDAGFSIERAETTVLIPDGPEFLIKLGEWIERHTRHTIMPIFGLRRIIIGRRL